MLILLGNANATANDSSPIMFTLSMWLLWVSVGPSSPPKVKACSQRNAIRVQEGRQRMNVEDLGFEMTTNFADKGNISPK